MEESKVLALTDPERAVKRKPVKAQKARPVLNQIAQKAEPVVKQIAQKAEPVLKHIAQKLLN